MLVTCWLLIFIFTFVSPSLKFTIFDFFHHTVRCWHWWSLQYAGHVSNMNLVSGLALNEFSVAQWIERPPGVWDVIGSIPVGDSFYSSPHRLWHADYFHFHKIKVLLINSETTIITPWLTSPCRVPKMRKSNVIWRVFKWVNERKTSPSVTEVPWCIPKLLFHNAY